MAFSAVTGKSVRLPDGSFQTHIVVTNDANGNTFEDDLIYQPGADLAATQDILEARVIAAIDAAKKVIANKQLPLLPEGTVLDLTPASVAPTPPTADEQLAIDFGIAWRNVLVLEQADARKWGTAGQQSAITTQLATARSTAASLYQQKPAVCIPLMSVR